MVLVVGTLASTVLGVAVSFYFSFRILSPVRGVVNLVDEYRSARGLKTAERERRGEITELSTSVEALLTDVSAMLDHLEHKASTDPLTGLRNRRWLFEEAALVFDRARRETTSVAVAIFDIDHFKRFNDRFGHQAGDRALFTVAEMAQMNVRTYDLLARIGGEEFCIVMPNVTRQQAVQAMERLREAIEGAEVPGLQGERVTASFGLSVGFPGGEGLKSMLLEADKALYEAKARGRNKVSFLAHRSEEVYPGRAS
ncbi:GGDEF domain-containing protein [Xanthobacteraceae bacterium A53D]